MQLDATLSHCIICDKSKEKKEIDKKKNTNNHNNNNNNNDNNNRYKKRQRCVRWHQNAVKAFTEPEPGTKH